MMSRLHGFRLPAEFGVYTKARIWFIQEDPMGRPFSLLIGLGTLVLPTFD